ncbi:hypothetical protein [uncultured Nonlabens sp.]|uniref:hypothetical protein n=1 Tax=uncultured Nonlabens sp. TaxID=859306 RepID=UPI0026360EB0|nr:hypothetical protein [uncultured Nonlabens sp.]
MMIQIKKILLSCCCITLSLLSSAQDGVILGDPEAEVVINSQTAGVPTLAMNSQTVPHGDTDGQLAVIEGILYRYDKGRNKWLSIETSMFTFALLGNVDNEPLEYVGDVEEGGPMLPMDGTVVSVTASANGGELNKQMGIEIYSPLNPAGPVFSVSIFLQNGEIALPFQERDDDFPAGIWAKVIVSDIADDGTADGPVRDPMFSLWVKWRKDNPPAP